MLACLGAVASLFMPAATVMGLRVQAMAVMIEREFLSNKSNPDFNRKNGLIDVIKNDANSSLANRLLRAPKRKILPTRYDEHVINPPSFLVMLKRLGGALVAAAQFSLAFGINVRVLKAIHLPLAVISLLHTFVSREFVIKAGRKSLYKVAALSDKSPYMAKAIK